MRFIIKLSLFFLFIFNSNSFGQNKILFNATKAEMAGNADWIVDADANTILFSSTTHLPYVNTNTSTGESNPQRFPTPAQSGITTTTDESFWTGGISAWAVDCAKQGYVVETLPWNGQITYGNTSNVQDLSNYRLFVVPEPNILFTTAEKTAIMNFINNGGSLYMISDHAGADRNNDGYDSPMIWNDFMETNPVQNNPFGIQFNLVNSPNGITEYTTKIANLPTDPLLHGAFGNVTKLKYSGGDSMTLNTTQNPNIKGVIYQSTSPNSGLNNVFCCYTTYGSGKVAAIGDSSPFDDNSGDVNDTLYDGYYDSTVLGNHQRLIMNTTIWLMTQTLSNQSEELVNSHFIIAPNPIQNKQINLSFNSNASQNANVSIFDALGRLVKETKFSGLNDEINNRTIDASDLQNGIYICKLTIDSGSKSLQIIVP